MDKDKINYLALSLVIFLGAFFISNALHGYSLGLSESASAQVISTTNDSVSGGAGGGGGGGSAIETTAAKWCFDFRRNLRIGDRGNDVLALQYALSLELGNIVFEDAGAYEEETASAVSGFQEKYKSEVLTPARLRFGTGYFGKSTRARLNRIFGCAMPRYFQPNYDASPTTIIRGETYEFTAKISWARPEANIVFFLQRPDGSFKYSDQAAGGESQDILYKNADRLSNARGNFSLSVRQTITEEGQNGIWTSWVTVGGIPSNKVYHQVISRDAVNQSSITVLSPNGGEQWQSGTTQTIKWQSYKPPACSAGAPCPVPTLAPVTITLYQYNAPCTFSPCQMLPAFLYTIAKNVSDSGSFNWVVGKNLDGANVLDGKYIIQVSNSSQSDISDAPFSIVSSSLSTKFSVSDKIKTTAIVNMRRTPCLSSFECPILGTQAVGALGTISASPLNLAAYPANVGGYLWWYVNFDNGADGWVVENYLEKVVSPASLGKLYIEVDTGSGFIQTSDAIKVDVGQSRRVRAMYQPVMPPCPIGYCEPVMPAPQEVSAQWTSSNQNIANIVTAVPTCVQAPCSGFVSVFGISAGTVEIKALYAPYPNSYTATAKVSVGAGAEQSARDIRRITDIKQLQIALELYFDAHGSYPVSKGSYPVSLYSLAPAYITKVPSDPLGNMYFYVPLNDGCGGTGDNPCKNYHLGANLELSANLALISDADANTSLLWSGSGINGSDKGPCRSSGVTGYCYDVSAVPIEQSPSITVLSPNGGEQWQIGQTYQIRWNGDNVPTGAVIGIALQDTQTANNYLFTNISNSGLVNWTIPNNIVPGQYRMRIFCSKGISDDRYCSIDGTKIVGVEDYSDAPFSIVAPGTANYILSASYVSGNKTSYAAGEKISLAIKGVELFDGSPGESGEGFNVQVYVRGTNDGYSLQGVNAVYNSQTGYWDAKLTAPADTSKTYKVDSAFYCSNSSLACGKRYASGAGGGNGQINITFDFSVYGSGRTPVIVVSPNGNESYQAGQSTQIPIRWTADCGYKSFSIMLAKGTYNGFSGQMVNDSIPAGICSLGQTAIPYYTTWPIPANLAAGSDYKILVTGQLADSIVGQFGYNLGDDSDKPFSIVVTIPTPVPVITINDTPLPNGTVGVAYPQPNITALGIGSDAKWSVENINTFQVISALPPGLGITTSPVSCNSAGACSTNGVIFGTPTAVGTYTFYIKVTSGGRSTSKQFQITVNQPTTQPSITVTAPNGGEIYRTGDTVAIKWNSTGLSSDTVKIELGYYQNDPTYPGGSYIEEWIVEKVPNTGSYTWKIPEIYGLGVKESGFTVKISAGPVVDYSNSQFTIKMGVSNPTLNVSSPAAGAIYAVGSAVPVQWSPDYNVQPVRFSLLRKSDTSFVRWINVGGTGTAAWGWVWTIPSGLSGNDYYIRVETHVNGIVSGIGYSGVFTIVSSAQPSIASFSATKIDSEGFNYRLAWTTIGTNQVQLTQYPSVSGVSATSDSGQSLGVTNTFLSPGSVNIRFTNGYSYPTRASFILDPLPLNFSQVELFRRTLTVDVPSNTTSPVATSFSPASGIAGTKVTINGNGFLPTGNNIAFVKEPGGPEFDVNNLSSSDGRTLSFTVPNSTIVIGEDGISRTVYVTPGQYYFVVDNMNGKSAILHGFTITSNTQPSITVTSPKPGSVLAAGMNYSVSWLYSGVSSNAAVNIEIQKGSNVIKVYSGYLNTGSQTLQIPSDLVLGSDYQINVIYKITPDSGVIGSTAPLQIVSSYEGGYDVCRLDKLDGNNITRDAFIDQNTCLAKICDVYGPANLANGLESKCLFKGQEIKRYTKALFATATFLSQNTTSKGSWKPLYGAEGKMIMGDVQSSPPSSSVAFSGKLDYIWQNPTTDIRGLEKANSTDRIAATWYSDSSFNVNVNLAGTNATHQVALYFLDWDGARAQTIEVRDTNTNTLLDTRSVSSFSGGIYLVWNIKGNVTFRLTNASGSNAVLSGIFFGGGIASSGGGGGGGGGGSVNASALSKMANIFGILKNLVIDFLVGEYK